MNKYRFTIKLLAIAILTSAFASLAQAQATRTWVTGSGGDDAGPCSRTAPCSTFGGAISKTAEGGEINVLSPGGYGPLTITKAVTVDGGIGAGWASVQVQSSQGIIVNISTTSNHANDAVVTLRNLSFNGFRQTSGLSPGTHGISYLRAAQLKVENCQFQNLVTTGIRVALGATSGNLTVQDCVFENVNSVIVSNATAPAFSVIQFEHNRMVGSSTGLNAQTNTYATVRDSYFGSFTSSNGAVRAGTGSQVNVINSMFVNNVVGANVAGGTIRLSNNEFFDNATAITGTAESANNNKFRGNTADGTTTNSIVVQ
jgi:hypothetical protein